MDELTNQRLREAGKLLDTGHTEEACNLFQSLYESASDPAERAYAAQAVVDCLRRMGRREEARRVLAEAIKGVPEDHWVRVDLEFADACLLCDEKEFDEALQILERILPDSRAYLDSAEGRELYRDIQVWRGFLFTEFERYREAAPVLEEALSLELRDEQKADVLYNLGVSYYGLGKKNEAKEKFQAALDAGVRKDAAVRAHHYLGLIHFENRAYAWAKQEFEFSERHTDEGSLSRKRILEMLFHTCQRLGLHDEARHYEELARQS